MTTALVAYAEDEASADDVAASIEPRGVSFPVQVSVASTLVNAGEIEAAESVLTNLRPHLAARPPGRQAGRQASFVLELAVAEARGGCDGVEELWLGGLRDRIEETFRDTDQIARAWKQGRGGSCPVE